ncbi:MAG: glycosyltransferase family 39 protein [Candidatus Chisholmbacteria bacterium]|nr:glycosyltransferase family 39 protein [Candidatus Chisholmbacteria bacterium]
MKRRGYFGLVLLTVLVLVAKTARWNLRNWDEAWYAEITKNMAVYGYGWIGPYWNGRYYFDQPPLYFWLSGLVVKIFGLGEWQVRMVSIVSGFVVLWLVYLLGGKLFNPRVGLWSSLIFLTLGGVVMRFAYGNLEALLIALFLATIYLYLESRGRWRWIVVAGVTLGLGFLVKGWLQGLLPVIFIVVWMWVTRRRLPWWQLLMMIITGAAIFGTWFGAGALEFGEPFIDRYLFKPAAGRLGNPLDNFSLEQFGNVARDVKWWFLPIFGLGWWQMRGALAKEDVKKLTALIAVIIGYLLALSFLDEKSGWYPLPVYPFVALVAGYVMERWWRVWPTLTTVAFLFLLALGAVNAYRVEMIYPDRSHVGVALGKYAQKIIPQGETVVWDDHDFTAFLFYSDLGMVYVPEADGAKPGEWWILTYEEVPKLSEEKGGAWIVTPDKSRFPKGLIDRATVVTEYRGYTFFRLEKS